MRLVDLTHPWNLHTPGWVGYPGARIYYTQTLQTNRIVSQRIETSLHTGTHLDGPMHGTDGGLDIASLPLEKLVHQGVVVDVSDVCKDWDVIRPEHIVDRVEVRRGDILIIHTGFHRYYQGQPEQDLVRYFCMHPGGGVDLARWMLELEISWWGIDAGSGDHPINTTIRHMRPDITERFESKVGMSAKDYFGEYSYTHHLSGREITEDLFPMHYLAFPGGCIHAENVGGEIDRVLNTRCVIGAFPWKFEGGEACPCRIIAFLDVPDLHVEELRDQLASPDSISTPRTRRLLTRFFGLVLRVVVRPRDTWRDARGRSGGAVTGSMRCPCWSAVPGPRRSGATAVPGVHGEKAPSQALPYPGYWTSGIRLSERLNLQLS